MTLVRAPEPAEVEDVGVADHGHHEGARAVPLLDVDGEAEAHPLTGEDPGLAVAALDVGAVHGRHGVGDGPHDGVADEVGEADLAAPGATQVAVDDPAVDLEQLGRDLAEAGGGGDAEAGLHVGDDAGGGAPERVALLGRRSGRTVALSRPAVGPTLTPARAWARRGGGRCRLRGYGGGGNRRGEPVDGSEAARPTGRGRTPVAPVPWRPPALVGTPLSASLRYRRRKSCQLSLTTRRRGTGRTSVTSHSFGPRASVAIFLSHRRCYPPPCVLWSRGGAENRRARTPRVGRRSTVVAATLDHKVPSSSHHAEVLASTRPTARC